MKRTEKIAKLVKATRIVADRIEKTGIRGYKGHWVFDENRKPVDFVGHIIDTAGLKDLVPEDEPHRTSGVLAVSAVLNLSSVGMSKTVKQQLVDLMGLSDRHAKINKRIAATALRQLADEMERGVVASKKERAEFVDMLANALFEAVAPAKDLKTAKKLAKGAAKKLVNNLHEPAKKAAKKSAKK